METIRAFFRRLRGKEKKETHFIKEEPMPPVFKYFKPIEIKGLSNDLVYKLDRARENYGYPIIITSGFRTELENDMANGVKDSAHLTGQAADIRAPHTHELKERLIWALTLAGIRRIGSYDVHLHVDVDHTKTFPAFWTGVSQ